MENAGISVEAGPPDQLDQAFQLDFESNAELEAFEAEGLDFGLGGAYEEFEHVSTEEVPVDSYAGFDPILDDGAAEPELDQADLEVYPADTDDKTAQTTEATNNAEDDSKADVEYHDEIGYEDDDALAAETNAELSTTEADETEGALADTSSEGHPAPGTVADDDGQLEGLSHGNDVSWGQDIDFEDHGESTEPQDAQHALDDADEEETAHQQEGNYPTVGGFDDETAHEQLDADHHAVDLDKELDDLTRSLAEVPDVEVLYNQEYYSLFGAPGDDPDSYFLSGVEKLDCPLSQFLSALRAVISDEIAATDELVVRFDPLDLEFGERSNEEFLNRSFRELLDCHSTLGQVPSVSADPVLHLTVRRDSEEHFLELLTNVAQVNGSPSSAEDSEMSENHEEGSRTNDLDDEQVQDEAFEDGNMDEYHDEGEHTVTDHEEEAELEISAPRDDASGEQEQDNQFDATGPQPSDTAEGEEHVEIPPTEGVSHDIEEDRADEEQAWDEQVAEGDIEVVPQHPEITPGETNELNQPAEQQGDEVPESSDPSAVDGVAAPNNGESEQEANSNGKFPSFLSPTSPISTHKSPAMNSPLPVNEALSAPASSFRAAGKLLGTSQLLMQASSAARIDEEALWEIDYSDEEYEPTPSGNSESRTSPVPQLQAQSTISRVFGTSLNRARASSVGSSCTSSFSQPSDVSITFSVDVSTDNDAHQDDDLILAFDDEPGLPSIHEGEDEHEDTITYDDLQIPNNDAEDAQELVAAGTLNEFDVGHSEKLGQGTDVAETASVHTSTTINGDEIDYDEDDVADGSSAPANNDAEQSVAASGDEKDEIDWENDEDEYEQQPAIENTGVDYEESKEVPLTSPSVAGKRSRADETESLADETDYKRRRT